MLLCRETLIKLRPNLDDQKIPLFIFVNKGIEIGTQALTLEIIVDTCGPAIARAATFIVSALYMSHLVDNFIPAISPDHPLLKKVSIADGSIIFLTVTSHIVVRRQPTSVSVASFSQTQAQKTSELFHQPWFRW